MRYILDDLGYVEAVSFGAYIECNNKTCTEYTGLVPEGYDSLIAWVDNANIRAYKIVDGNLVYDEARATELEALLKKGNVLWEGAYYMTGGHIIDLSNTPISQQPKGIVLVFSAYTNSTIHDYNFCTYFLPKEFVSLHPGCGVTIPLSVINHATLGHKYLYFSDKKITGNDKNNEKGTANGVTYDNKYWVLREVIGI